LRNEGDILSVSHPAGEFFFDPEVDKDSPLVLLSAGVGLTPMVSILNTLLERGSTQHISFVHSARKTSVQAFGDYIRDVVKKQDNVTASFFIGIPGAERDIEGVHYHHTGRVRLDVLDGTKDLFLKDSNAKYFICGPQSFMSAMEKKLLEFGIDQERIKMEIFGTGDMVRT
jgi:nitric oxide dioxygenase